MNKVSQLDMSMPTRARPSFSSPVPCMYTNVSNNNETLQGLEENVRIEQIFWKFKGVHSLWSLWSLHVAEYSP